MGGVCRVGSGGEGADRSGGQAQSMGSYGFLWGERGPYQRTGAVNGFLWVLMGSGGEGADRSGGQAQSMGSYGFLWVLMGRARTVKANRRSQWVLIGSYGFLWGERRPFRRTGAVNGF